MEDRNYIYMSKEEVCHEDITDNTLVLNGITLSNKIAGSL